MKSYGCSDWLFHWNIDLCDEKFDYAEAFRLERPCVYVCSCIFHLSFPTCPLCMWRSHLDSRFSASAVLATAVGVIPRWDLKYWKAETSCFLFEFMTHSLCEHSENAHFMPQSFRVIFYATMLTGTIISRWNFVYWRISFI